MRIFGHIFFVLGTLFQIWLLFQSILSDYEVFFMDDVMPIIVWLIFYMMYILSKGKFGGNSEGT